MSKEEEVCMNVLCRGAPPPSSSSSSSIDYWRKGWNLRSGCFANLCDKCGFAYEQLVFCDTFHLKESGWRECSSCRKRLHCGCIASKSLLELLDNGGVECISCIKSSEGPSVRKNCLQLTTEIQIPSDEKPTVFSATVIDNVEELRSTSMENKIGSDSIEMVKVLQMGKRAEVIEQNDLLQSQRNDTNGSHCQIKKEQGIPPGGEVGCTSNIPIFKQGSIGSYQCTKRDSRKEIMGVKELPQTCLSMNIGGPMGTIDLALPLSGVVIEGRELSKVSPSLQQIQRSRNLLPKPPKMGLGTAPEATKDMVPQIRVARPPVEGRIKNQLLPRYWPRITEQELQQISGDSNSTIVPLFEKVLSASDAGRIGRLVLPKACAEAYFPPISQPEGLPLRIQDAKGKDWVFQFRFWPNNNSRMYVLEGVTPCIQSMQLQAGDTVTFSRIDPEGKLVMGFRKASNSGTLQDAQISSIANGALANATFYSGVIENLPVISGYSGLLQSLKGSTDPHLNALSEHIRSADGDINWLKSEKHGRRPNGGLQVQQLLVPEKKRSRNIGSKSKRLLIDSEAALELKLTWEEAQDLLRSPPSVKPSIVIVEDHVFEEYEEPPVFGKKSIFTSGGSGGQDQWSQCDNCYKWRRLPVDALLPPKWTCADNTWDSKRCMCSVPDELSPKELENLFRLNMDFKKRRIAIFNKAVNEHEPSGLDTLATAAVLGENGVDSGTASVATTTKHPRHRPGCTCIVCIQPPSGKGPKHKPTCTCNVCMTVKRRFKTLMMRKKKRQSEKEAEIAQRKCHIEGGLKDEMEVESSSRCMQSPVDASENEAAASWLQANESKLGSHNRIQIEKDLESGKSQLDLNCDPSREDDSQQGGACAGLERVSMMSLLQVASRPLETYLKQNGLRSLMSEQQTNSSNSNNALVVPLQAAAENSEGIMIPPDDGNLVSVVQDHRESEVGEEEEEEEHCTPDPVQTDPV